MSVDLSLLPTSQTIDADSEAVVAETLLSANATQTPVYPVGGATSLNLGLPARQPGLALRMNGMHRVADYPARDMTITVAAGITLDQLAKTLAPEGQRLPIDAPASERATLGGLIACNHSGPLRYGHGTLRDHVIGIRAIDGRGTSFAAGGRVVKNVAGYDLCKLLTGSLGTLGVITEVTIKLRPIPAARALVACGISDLDDAEKLLAAFVSSQTTPAIVELLAGDAWDGIPGHSDHPYRIVVGFEGTAAEVEWMTAQLSQEWQPRNASMSVIAGQDEEALREKLVEFAADDDAALVMKFTGLPSRVTAIVQQLVTLEPGVSIQSHAGNGIVIAKFAQFPNQSLPRLKSIAASALGHATILSNPSGNEMTHQSVWGAASVPFDIMRRVKQNLDPNNILNPGRFVY